MIYMVELHLAFSSRMLQTFFHMKECACAPNCLEEASFSHISSTFIVALNS